MRAIGAGKGFVARLFIAEAGVNHNGDVQRAPGERALGGTLSWTEPQAVTDFPPTGPFADLPRPEEVTAGLPLKLKQ